MSETAEISQPNSKPKFNLSLSRSGVAAISVGVALMVGLGTFGLVQAFDDDDPLQSDYLDEISFQSDGKIDGDDD